MVTRREEARDPSTSPERLHELISLPGDRGDCDSDAGWCREYVAANPNAAPATLAELSQDGNDFLVRRFVAENPSTPVSVVEMLAGDVNLLTAATARRRLGLPPQKLKGLTQVLESFKQAGLPLSIHVHPYGPLKPPSPTYQAPERTAP